MEERYKRFAEEYIKDFNGTQAIFRCGYNMKNNSAATLASRFLKRVDVAQYIEELKSKITSENIATAEEVLEYYTKCMRGEYTDELVSYNPTTMKSDKVTIKAPTKERTAAARELAKYHGIATEKIDVSSNQVVIVEDLEN